MVGLKEMGEGSHAIADMTGKNILDLADHVMQIMFHGLTGFLIPSYGTS